MAREIVITDLDNYVGMQLVCEVLIARPDALAAAFPGWQKPLPHPVARQLHNPFTNEPIYRDTGEPYLITTRAPDGPWPDEISCPNLERFQRCDLAPIGHHEIATLGRCLLSRADEIIGALFAPPSYGWNLWAIPQSLTATLSELVSTADIPQSWLAALRAQSHADDDLLAQVADWNAALDTLVQLARRAMAESAQLFVYEGPKPHRHPPASG